MSPIKEGLLDGAIIGLLFVGFLQLKRLAHGMQILARSMAQFAMEMQKITQQAGLPEDYECPFTCGFRADSAEDIANHIRKMEREGDRRHSKIWHWPRESEHRNIDIREV